MQIAIVTMVYNERVNLPIWIRHYTNHCPGATLFVIDHGSDDGSTQGLIGVNLVPLPRTPFDDQIRVSSSRISNTIYCDSMMSSSTPIVMRCWSRTREDTRRSRRCLQPRAQM